MRRKKRKKKRNRRRNSPEQGGAEEFSEWPLPAAIPEESPGFFDTPTIEGVSRTYFLSLLVGCGIVLVVFCFALVLEWQ